MVKNYMEEAVDRVMGNIKKELSLKCGCERCLNDIRAIALNKLTPHYVVTSEGEVYAKVNQLFIQFEADIIKEIAHAARIVGESPRH